LKKIKEKLKETNEFYEIRLPRRLAEQEQYVFADIYTGLDADASDPTEEDLEMVDLIRWTYGLPVTTSIPTDRLSQMVWLQNNLIEENMVFRKHDSWVSLMYRLLFKMVVSNSWPACCIAVVCLAILRKKYPMHKQHEWDCFVADLMNQYDQLDVDPLGQACLARLCLSTSNPPKIMAQNLPEIISQATFDAEVRIPELVELSGNESQDVASEYINDSLRVVIVRCEHQEVIFANFVFGWSLSVQPIEARAPDAEIRRLIWGTRPEQSMDVERQSRMWRYINSHHDRLIAQVTQELRQRILTEIASMVERANRPLRLL
jgi:hypothetical protein